MEDNTILDVLFAELIAYIDRVDIDPYRLVSFNFYPELSFNFQFRIIQLSVPDNSVISPG